MSNEFEYRIAKASLESAIDFYARITPATPPSPADVVATAETFKNHLNTVPPVTEVVTTAQAIVTSYDAGDTASIDETLPILKSHVDAFNAASQKP